MSIQLSPLFCDHTVLPARKPIRVFGSGSPDGIRVSHRIEGRELVVTLTANPEMKMSEFDFPRPFAAERGDRILLTQSYAVATVNFGDKPFVMGDGFKLAPGGHRMEKRK